MRVLLAFALVGIGLAGCAETSPVDEPPVVPTVPALTTKVPIVSNLLDPMHFTEHVVDAAVGYTNDLYEPTMEVSDSGVIYVTGHSILVDSTGPPVWFSKDDGLSWAQLPWFQDQTMPGDIHGAGPPPSDEIFLVAGDDGQLWGVDITLVTYPINGWCEDGARHCYHNPNAYDEVQAMVARGEAVTAPYTSGESSCSVANLNDRPFVAYANGRLLLSNNPGGGPVQIALMDTPQLPVGGPGMGLVEPVAADWNLCAGHGGGAIPGIPDMRNDHFFAVPQVQSGELVIVKGYNDVHDVEQVTVFPNTNTGGGTSNYGQVVFDHSGAMFIGIRNNTQEPTPGDGMDNRTGQLHLAVSLDDGTTFVERTFVLSAPSTSIYMDGNRFGDGALLTWAQIGKNGTDWYAAHVFVGPEGEPVVENVSIIWEGGTSPSAHIQGAANGPDGRAYMVTFHGGYGPLDGHNPLHVWVQQTGPTLPVLPGLGVLA